MAHYNHFQIMASASIGEQIPVVAGAYTFALPYRMDASVPWQNYFSGIEPRAFLLGMYPEGHAKEWQVYPLDLDLVNDSAPEVSGPEIANFIGLCLRGTDYENDLNITVVHAGGINVRYIQQDQSLDPYELDPAAKEAFPKLGIKHIKQHIFWNVTQGNAN